MQYLYIVLCSIVGSALSIIAYHLFSNRGPTVEWLITFLNSNFSAALFGAIGASVPILLFNVRIKQNQALADINSALGSLTRLQGTLLTIKKQLTIPRLEQHWKHREMYNFLPKNVENEEPISENIIPMNVDLTVFNYTKLDLHIPTENIFSLTHEVADIAHILAETQSSVASIEPAIEFFNNEINKINLLKTEDRIPYYLGLRHQNDLVDTSYIDSLGNLNILIDDTLFFIRKSIEMLSRVGNDSLPRRLTKKIAIIEFIDKEYAELMPPRDHLDGFDY